MQTLPALLPRQPSALGRDRWIAPSSINALRSTAIGFARGVVLSGTASLIIVAAHHRLTEAADTTPGAATPVQNSAQVVASSRAETEARPAAGTTPPPVAETVGEPSAPQPDRDASRARAIAATAPLPVRRLLHLAGDPDGAAQRATNTDAGEKDRRRATAPATRPRPGHGADPIPLPPLRSMLDEAKPLDSQAFRAPALPPPAPTSRPVVLAVTHGVPPHARRASDDGLTLGEPLRYGMRLAAGVGDFAMSTNDRLMAGTTDAIGFLVK